MDREDTTARRKQQNAQDALVALSRWVDDHNAGKEREARTWGRLSKIGEEFGEVVGAYIGATDQNPRKGYSHTMIDVRKELLDVALTALCAYDHLTGNVGHSVNALFKHIENVAERAGLS